jgi:hypothetical protein
MSLNRSRIAAQAAKGAASGAVAGAAGAIVTGAALVQVPVTLMWIPIAATTVVAWPAAIGIGAAAALVAGTVAGVRELRRQAKINAAFNDLKGKTSSSEKSSSKK